MVADSLSSLPAIITLLICATVPILDGQMVRACHSALSHGGHCAWHTPMWPQCVGWRCARLFHILGDLKFQSRRWGQTQEIIHSVPLFKSHGPPAPELSVLFLLLLRVQQYSYQNLVLYPHDLPLHLILPVPSCGSNRWSLCIIWIKLHRLEKLIVSTLR